MGTELVHLSHFLTPALMARAAREQTQLGVVGGAAEVAQALLAEPCVQLAVDDLRRNATAGKGQYRTVHVDGSSVDAFASPGRVTLHLDTDQAWIARRGHALAADVGALEDAAVLVLSGNASPPVRHAALASLLALCSVADHAALARRAVLTPSEVSAYATAYPKLSAVNVRAVPRAAALNLAVELVFPTSRAAPRALPCDADLEAALASPVVELFGNAVWQDAFAAAYVDLFAQTQSPTSQARTTTGAAFNLASAFAYGGVSFELVATIADAKPTTWVLDILAPPTTVELLPTLPHAPPSNDAVQRMFASVASPSAPLAERLQILGAALAERRFFLPDDGTAYAHQVWTRGQSRYRVVPFEFRWRLDELPLVQALGGLTAIESVKSNTAMRLTFKAPLALPSAAAR